MEISPEVYLSVDIPIFLKIFSATLLKLTVLGVVELFVALCGKQLLISYQLESWL